MAGQAETIHHVSMAPATFVVTLLVGLVTTVEGVVLVGWYTYNMFLVHMMFPFVPMAFVTALSFVVSGVGLTATALRSWRVVTACAVAILLIGVVALLLSVDQSGSGISWPAQLSPLATRALHANRMAPGAALGLVLFGAILLIMGRPGWFTHRPSIVGLVGSSIVTLGVAGFSSALTDPHVTSRWVELTQMPFHMALGLMVLGAGVIVLALHEERAAGTRGLRWLPFFVGLGIVTATLLIHQALPDSAKSQIETMVLMVGFLVAVLLALAISFAQATMLRVQAIEAINQRLQVETKERQRVAASLEEARADLERRVDERTRQLAATNASLQREIGERQRVEEQLRHDAFYDGLTDLPNRALFMDRLERVLARAKRQADYRFAVLFLDLDHFKLVNDSLGHQAGDQLLVELASRLQQCVRGSDTVARLGGDEFAILLDDLRDESNCFQVADRIHQDLTQPFILHGQEVFTNGSIGVALSLTGYDSPGDLLRDADIAMYRAKDQGRGRYEVFDTAMRSSIVERVQLEAALRRAIEQHEFLVYYQPIVSLPTGRLAGFEALVRWQHAEWGLVSPNEFIPIAEETGLIVPLGRWVLAEACRQMHAWHRQYLTTPPLMISVNLSGKQVVHSKLLDEIQQILRETGLDPYVLKLEMTESVLIEHGRAVLDLCSSLRAMGIKLGIDDFGTGYSSLSYLHRFPIDTLKIDRAFVSKIDSDEKDHALVKTILAIAQTLHLETIAEGIETTAHLAVLRTLECAYGQGYLFSRPVAGPVAEALIAQNPQW